MSVSVNDFWNRITTSGLADSGQCRRWAVDYAQVSGSPPTNVKELAKWLITAKHLTVYQVQQLVKGTATNLIVGDFVLSGLFDRPPLSSWYDAKRSGETNASGSLLCNLTENQSASVKASLLRGHQSLSHANLQPIDWFQHGERSMQEVFLLGANDKGRRRSPHMLSAADHGFRQDGPGFGAFARRDPARP